jgi:hypothetical protein
LRKLGELLIQPTDRDEKGHYFGGPIALNSYVLEYGKTAGLRDLTVGRVKVAVNILIFVGALELGKSGPKPEGYKRRFYPDKVNAITTADLMRFRAAKHGAHSPLPRARK